MKTEKSYLIADYQEVLDNTLKKIKQDIAIDHCSSASTYNTTA